MKYAKIISIIGGIFYLLLWIQYLFASTRLSDVYSDLNIDYNPLSFIFGNLVGLVLVAANFGYFYFLRRKEKQGDEVKKAVLFSILIAVVPLIIFPMISAISLILPIYNIKSAF